MRKKQEDEPAYAEALRRIEACCKKSQREFNLSSLGLTTLPPEIGNLSALTTLYLNNNQLSTLPPEIGNLSALTTLYLNNNQLSTLPPEIGNLSALTTLYLNNNQLRTLPPKIGNLSALTELHLYNNQLSTLPPKIGNLSALTELHLDNNPLSTLPPEIGNLSALTKLHLDNNPLRTLPPEIGNLSALTKLHLDNNPLRTLPPEIGNLSALTKLHLDNNPLRTLPPEIGNLSALTTLYLNNNQLSTLPPEIGNLSALTTLYLNNNQLSTLPPEIGNLSALTTLYLNNNQLSTLPPKIGNLSALTELHLDNNQLSTLPPEIGNLSALTELYLHDNQLSTLPPKIGNLSALTTLGLSNNKLSTLPPEIGNLSALTGVGLNNNQLRTLPPEIGDLTALTSLYLYDNQLSTLPPEIGNLSALTTLYLHDNQLSTLPPEIGNLTALTSLDISRNHLTSLPREAAKLTTLTSLDLRDNPGLGLLVEALEPHRNVLLNRRGKIKRPIDILASYFRIDGEAGEVLGECKLIVVGRGQAGKTSLVKRLNGMQYDSDEPETHGITIQRMKFTGRRGQVIGRIWDFGGQIVLHSMHEFFLTARSLYLLVLGERDDMLERDATYWLQLIRSYAGNVPVVVALNKSGGRQRHFDRKSLEENYGPILGWVSTECSNPNEEAAGIAMLRETLTAALDSDYMESARRKFPKKWHTIKAHIEEMTESYLDYETYARRCQAFGEPDANEQAALASDLHDLGVALNYGRDPRLRDTTVLRPDWLANGIYAVLRANDLDDRLPPKFNRPLAPDGVVTAESLALIHEKAQAWKMLKATDYPPEKRDFLLRLMDLFHLSYPLDDEGREQLVPTLLPLNPPPGTEEPENVHRVRLRYEFQVVPAPLLPWFIARMFALIPNRLHWRRGAVLEFSDARAKVWATQDDRYVFATVAGSDHTQMRLLAMIRGTLQKIFNEYKALNPVEQWEHKGKWVPRETLEEFGVLLRQQSDATDESPTGEEVKS